MTILTSKKRILENESAGKGSHEIKKQKKCSNNILPESEKANKMSEELQAVCCQPSDKFESSQPLVSKRDQCDEADTADIADYFESSYDSPSHSDSSISEASFIHTNTPKMKIIQKRNDPDVFAKSMSMILSSKLPNSKRRDPVLARSIDAQKVSSAVTDVSLETKARRKLRIEKKEALEKGRVRDVLASSSVFDTTRETNSGLLEESFQKITEEERRLRKTAQRGVIKLFNAVRAAQIKGEEASREASLTGLVGNRTKEDKINEMSKKGFLDLIAKGGGELMTDY